ncbi:RluA family pseudouridine synthase [Puniceicoccaceae bacterium K14]|nr:RluA family pseudouridine synthase [Puniceicoccaceae bacterium K14]
MSLEEIEYIVPEGYRKERADKVLSEAFDEHSRADFHRAFDEKLVTMNGAVIPKNKRVSDGDVIYFSMPEVKVCDMSPVEMPLDIVYEDECMLAINKRPGVVVHPGAGVTDPTLAHGLLFHCKGQLSGIGGVERPGIVHRLDKETSGLIIAAKTDVAHRALSEQFSERLLKKEYLAIVAGVPELLSGSIVKNIDRHPVHRYKMATCSEEKGRYSHTDWKVEKAHERGFTLVRCRIHTGRTHQIRVHMNYLGHPLLGDKTYGFRELEHPNLPVAPPRVMLHSEYLGLAHPLTQEPLELIAPIPEDFKLFV